MSGTSGVLQANVSLQLTAPVTHPGATPADAGERRRLVPRPRARGAAAELRR